MSLLDPVQLIVELKRLISEPVANAAQIRALVEKHQGMAEYQIARFYVARHLTAQVSELFASIDPRQRRAGVELIRLGFPRTLAGSLLRRVVKDPDIAVRKRARATLKKFGLTDVALPDQRFKPPKPGAANAHRIIGGWNVTGWAFGLFHPHSEWTRNVRPVTRRAALGAHGLPELKTLGDVLTFLGLDAKSLARYKRPGSAPGAAYVEFEVPKAKGGTRRLAAPRGGLRAVQRKILDEILAKVPQHTAAHGFIADRSTVTNAAPHVGAALVVKTDLVDFFPTVHYHRVLGLFTALGYNGVVAAELAALTTYRPKLDDGRVLWPGVLPQGAPTSPALANLACRRLDARLATLAAKYGATYTRYADDLTFSFAQPPQNIGRFFWWISSICQQEGFLEHTGKRKLLRKNTQQRVTGVVVNDSVHVPRRDRRRFRAILHNIEKRGLEAEAKGRDDFAAYLQGYAAYVKMVQPELGAAWLAQIAKLLGDA